MPETTLPPSLIQAYRETNYRVLGPEGFVLRVDEANPDLRRTHRQHHTDCSAFVTACNPFSRELDSTANEARQAHLATELRSRSLAFAEGVGEHPASDWGGEPSFLVYGLTLEAARALCNRLEQNAFIWSGSDSVPRLVLLR